MAKNKVLTLVKKKKDKTPSPITVLLNCFKNDKPELLELMELEAEFKRNKYNFLTKNGFTAEQALELVKDSCLIV